MKTLDQVIRYTSLCTFPDEDWLQVVSFCVDLFGSGRVRKSTSPLSESTFQEFKDWFDNGIGSGEVMRYGHTVGIVAYSLPECTAFCAYYNYTKDVIIGTMYINKDRLFKADDEEVKSLQRDLQNSGVIYSKHAGKIIKIYTPEIFSYISYIAPDGTEGVGIISDITEKAYRFLVIGVNDTLLFDESIVKTELDVTPASKREIDGFMKLLISNRYVYMPSSHTIKKIPERGKKYWYITDKFTIAAAQDLGTPLHHERFRVGNYFTCHTEASLFLQELKELREEYNLRQDPE